METEYSSGAAQILTGLDAVTHEKVGGNAYKWYFLSLLVLTYLLSTVDRMVISVVAEPLKTAFHLSDKQIGLLNIAFSLPAGLAVLPMGWLADRVARRSLLSAAVAIWSVLTSMGAFSSNFITLLVARMGVGVGEAPLGPTALSMIADTFPIKQRNTAVGIYISGTNLGEIVLFFFGGWLLIHFDWRAVFLVAGGPGLVLAALLFFTTREPKRGASESRGYQAQAPVAPLSIKGALLGIFGNTALCFAILAQTLSSGVSYSFIMWTTSFLVRMHGLSVGHGAIWTGVGFGICSTIGALLVGPFADRFSKGDQCKVVLITIVSAFLASIGGVIMVLGGTLALSLAGLAVLATMTGCFVSTGYSLILTLAAPGIRGTTIGLAKVFFMIVGDGPIPWIVGAVSDAIGGAGSIRPALLCSLSLMLVAVALYMWIYTILTRQKNRAAAS